jgi:hypothetical protein
VQRVTTIQAVRSMWKNEDGNEGGSKKRGPGEATRSQSDQERCVEKQIREKEVRVRKSCSESGFFKLRWGGDQWLSDGEWAGCEQGQSVWAEKQSGTGS